MKKKIVALILVVGMLSTLLVGCGGGTDSTSTAGSTGEGDSAEQTTEQDAGPEEAVSEELATKGDMEVLDIFINHSWYPMDTFTGIIPEAIKAEVGIDLNVTIASSSEQLGLMIASGDLPDLVFTDQELDRLSNERLTLSYDELEESYGADFSTVRPIAVDIARSYSEDGKYYTLLNNFSTADEWASLNAGAAGGAAMFYRKDLLEPLGIDGSEISSLEELYEVLATVKEAYPERTPFGLGGHWKFQGIEFAVGVEASQFNPDTGEYYYLASAPKYREFLEAANYMHRQGFVSAEQYAVENEADSHQFAFNDGNVFYNWYLSNNDLTKLQGGTEEIHPDAEWAILPFLGDSSKGFSVGWSGVFVSRNVSNPEAAAKLLSYLHSVEGRRTSMWGREGIDFTLDENDNPQFSEEFLAVREAGELDTLYNWRFNFGSTAVEEIIALSSGIDKDVLAAITTHNKGREIFPEVTLARPTSSSAEGVIFANLEELKRVHEAKIIFTDTDEEFNQAFDEFVGALEQTGVQEYNDYMTNAIKEVRDELGW